MPIIYLKGLQVVITNYLCISIVTLTDSVDSDEIYLKGLQVVITNYLCISIVTLTDSVDSDEIYLKGLQVVITNYLCISIVTLTDNVDSDEIVHYMAFHLGLYCLSKCPFRDFSDKKGT